MKLKTPNFLQKTNCKLKILLCLTFFSIFMVITGLSRYIRYNDPKINLEGLIDNYLPDIFMGEYVFKDVTRYHIKRIDEIVLIKDIPIKTEQPVNYVKQLLEEQFTQNGWLLSTGFDPSKHDCSFLLTESNMAMEDGFETYAYRKKSYEPAIGSTGDLMCLLLTENQDGTFINVIIVTAKPTLAERILKLLSS